MMDFPTCPIRVIPHSTWERGTLLFHPTTSVVSTLSHLGRHFLIQLSPFSSMTCMRDYMHIGCYKQNEKTCSLIETPSNICLDIPVSIQFSVYSHFVTLIYIATACQTDSDKRTLKLPLCRWCRMWGNIKSSSWMWREMNCWYMGLSKAANIAASSFTLPVCNSQLW